MQESQRERERARERERERERGMEGGWEGGRVERGREMIQERERVCVCVRERERERERESIRIGTPTGAHSFISDATANGGRGRIARPQQYRLRITMRISTARIEP